MSLFRSGSISKTPEPIEHEVLDEAGVFLTAFQEINNDLEDSYAEFVKSKVAGDSKDALWEAEHQVALAQQKAAQK